MTQRMGRIRPSKRKLIQLYAALLYNAHLRGFLEGDIYTGNAKALCVPGLNCYSCPGAVGACPLGALQNALGAVDARTPWYVLGILLLFGLTLGRTVCGWLCPTGLVQELIHKLPVPKIRKGKVTRALTHVKYALLLVFVIIPPLLYAFREAPLPAFCKYICPAGTLGGAVALLLHPKNADLFSLLGSVFLEKLSILIALIGLSAFLYRPFCRFLCPLGAIYGLFNRFCLTGIRVEESACVRCGQCVAACKMDIRRLSDRECIQCGSCISACPKGAISLRAGKITLVGPRSTGRSHIGKMISAALVACLIAVLVLVNLPKASDAYETGASVGMRVPDFQLTLTDGSTFALSDQRGKVVVLNLWATWCAPCVKELPEFERLQKSHPEDVTVLAIHSDLITEDVAKWLSEANIDLRFAIEDTAEAIADLGGTTLLPQTIVLNSDGVVTYNQAGSVTLEALEKLVQEALN